MMFAAHRQSFEQKRKKHYNEFHAVKLARKLMQEEEGDEADDEARNASSVEGLDLPSTSAGQSNSTSKSGSKR